ncbi:unnamed protein product [Tilletia caries]|nr:hypothetical protein CF335_g256 [Tilletia laevis]CAD6939951.1 unnamed protein product [Tilletia caries]
MVYRKISHEVKEMIVELLLAGILTKEDVLVANIFSVSTLDRALRRWTPNGLSAPRKPTGRPRKLGDADIGFILARVQQKSDIMLDELARDLQVVGGPVASLTLLSRTLRRLNITRKKVTRRAREASRLAQAEFRLRMAQYSPKQLVFTDETGFDSRQVQRKYGWAPEGETAIRIVSGKRTKRATLIPGLCVDGIIAPKIFHHNINTDVFYDYLVRYLLPAMTPYPGPRSVLVMDNVPFHRSLKVRQLTADFGCRIEYTSPWSPMLNPIEESFSKIKSVLRRQGRCDDYSVLLACETITANDALGWMRHAGYVAAEDDCEP